MALLELTLALIAQYSLKNKDRHRDNVTNATDCSTLLCNKVALRNFQTEMVSIQQISCTTHQNWATREVKQAVTNQIYKAEPACSLFPETGHISQQILTKFGMRHPSIPRMVMGVAIYL